MRTPAAPAAGKGGEAAASGAGAGGGGGSGSGRVWAGRRRAGYPARRHSRSPLACTTALGDWQGLPAAAGRRCFQERVSAVFAAAVTHSVGCGCWFRCRLLAFPHSNWGLGWPAGNLASRLLCTRVQPVQPPGQGPAWEAGSCLNSFKESVNLPQKSVRSTVDPSSICDERWPLVRGPWGSGARALACRPQSRRSTLPGALSAQTTKTMLLNRTVTYTNRHAGG
jgi:hypothetical protein